MRLVGGLGNQLFGLAAGRFLQDHCGHRVRFNTWYLSRFGFDHGTSLMGRGLEDRFVSKAPIFGPNHKRIIRIRSAFGGSYQSPETGWDPGISGVRPGSKITGYFQSWRYAAELHTKIQSHDLMRRGGPSTWFRQEFQDAVAIRPVIVHLRRGDYRLVEDSLGIVGGDFVRDSLAKLRSSGINNPIWVFSDEPQHAREVFLELGMSARIIEPPLNSDSAESLVLMSQGVANVISNSSFAWWGAFLNPSAELVLAPQPWFKTLAEPRDLIPEHWLRVEHIFTNKSGKS